MFKTYFLGKLIADSAGFALLETLVAMGLLSLAVTMTVPGVFQVLHIEQYWQGRVEATRDLRHVGSRFGGDVLGSKSADLEDGVPADTVMLTTYIGEEITYSKNPQDELVRSHFDGDATTYENTLATKVNSIEFLLSGDMITTTLEIYSVGTETKTMVLRSTLR